MATGWGSDWIGRAARSAAAVRSERGPALEVSLLPPHASTRRYARVAWGDGTEIVMLLPPAGGPADEGGVTSAPTPVGEEPFVAVQRWLAGRGVRVPAMHALDEVEGAIWLEDVGSTDLDAFVSARPERLEGAYAQATEALVAFRRATSSEVPAFVSARSFDAALFAWELEHYVEWRLSAELGVALSRADRAALDAGFEALTAAVSSVPQGVIHRDFQSHNLMVVGDGSALVVLDFQDAMLGPVVYDAVALLRDSYVELPDEVLSRRIRGWAEPLVAAGLSAGLSTEALEAAFVTQTLQRKLKDAGRFVYIDRVKGNPSFLGYIPSSLRYVRWALDRLPEHEALGAVLRRLDPGLS